MYHLPGVMWYFWVCVCRWVSEWSDCVVKYRVIQWCGWHCVLCWCNWNCELLCVGSLLSSPPPSSCINILVQKTNTLISSSHSPSPQTINNQQHQTNNEISFSSVPPPPPVNFFFLHTNIITRIFSFHKTTKSHPELTSPSHHTHDRIYMSSIRNDSTSHVFYSFQKFWISKSCRTSKRHDIVFGSVK